MADSIYRQWKMLELIPRHPFSITIKQIMNRLEDQQVELPTYRTIQRDLDILMTVFPHLQNKKLEGTHHWFMSSAKVLEIPKMESPTALAFLLAEENLHAQLPPNALEHLQSHFNTASSILKKQGPEYSNWRDKVRVLPQTQQLISPEIDPIVLSNIYNSLLKNQRFNCKYYPRRDDQYKSYQVNPLALIFRGTVTYLVCTINDYTDVRLLSLHRFVEAKMVEIPCTTPNGFDLDSYIEAGHVDFLIGDYIDLELMIDEEVAIHLRESLLTPDQEIIKQDNGQSLFKVHVKDTGQLRWWLLGFAEQIEILKPLDLRQEFKKKTLLMAGKYSA